ncbi:MAG: SelB C-terminal domain-containing protein, partial [Acidobacteria bacterium]|nr:SelB C-terminal domain-containing protein [Acidobacteriota bacterium]
LKPWQVFDCAVEVLPDAARPLHSRQRVRLHIGTAEVLARVAIIGCSTEIEKGQQGFAQLRLESPVAAILGERFILRSYSPQTTIAGGSILRFARLKARKKNSVDHAEFLQTLADAKEDRTQLLRLFVEDDAEKGISRRDIRSITGWTNAGLDRLVTMLTADKTVIDADGILIAAARYDELQQKVLTAVRAFHASEPLRPGLSIQTLRETALNFRPPEIQKKMISSLISSGVLSAQGDTVKLSSHRTMLGSSEQKMLDALRAIYAAESLEVPKTSEAISRAAHSAKVDAEMGRSIFQLLLKSGDVVQINEEFCFSSVAIENLIVKLRQFAETSNDRKIDVADFKNLASVSRKFAIPLLEYFDRQRITVRSGNTRLIL